MTPRIPPRLPGRGFESDENGVRVRPVRTKSAFAKFKGIGNPVIGSSRQRIIRWVREVRGR